MRQLERIPLAAKVRLPQSARVVAVVDDGAHGETLLLEHDPRDCRPFVSHGFAVITPGRRVPEGAVFVAAWARMAARGGLCALYELTAPDVPVNVPPERHDDWRLLIDAGFTLRSDKAWLAPADVPPGNLSGEQYMAIARLQDHGYGPIVD